MTRVLAVQPVRRTFDSSQKREFAQLITTLQRATQASEVSNVSQLLMDEDGYIHPTGRVNKYRYTTLAFRNICDRLATGMSNFLECMAGVRRQRDVAASAYSFSEAVNIYNAVVRRRFASHISQRLTFLWNTHDKLLEGAYGSRYQILTNEQTFELADSLCSTGRVPMEFSGAVLLGRRMALRLKHRTPLFTVRLPSGLTHRYCGGIYFHNSELGGETSVRMATILTNYDTAVSAMSDSMGSRLSHAGRSFSRRVQSTAARLVLRLDEMQQLQTQLQALANLPLQLTSLNAASPRNVSIVNYLRSQGFSKSWARQVLYIAAVHGSELGYSQVPESSVDLSLLASRTAYDLFYAIIYEARNLAVNSREQAEQVAYGMLLDSRHLL